MESQRALVKNLMRTELKIRGTIHVRLPVTHCPELEGLHA
jgi:hypothetical protein